MVLYGHTPVPAPEWVNNTLCLDTGCVFGGRLTALRYPERTVRTVTAKQVYYQPVKPLAAGAPGADGPRRAAWSWSNAIDAQHCAIDDVKPKIEKQ